MEWMNLQGNSRLINHIYISCEKSEGSYSRQADKIQVKIKTFKLAVDQNI